MKKLAIMQPYFFPYIGYFQLIESVDRFVIYDNLQYTKKGWINRNRILLDGVDFTITVPVKSDSFDLHICDRVVSDSWEKDKIKLLNRIKAAYSKAPFYKEIYPLIEDLVNYNSTNLFDFLLNSVSKLSSYLEIKTEIIPSSKVNIDHTKKGKDKVISICQALESNIYINAIGGIELYDKVEFESSGIHLQFIKSDPIEYTQFTNKFVPWLSIIDVLMFNDKYIVQNYLKNYTLI